MIANKRKLLTALLVIAIAGTAILAWYYLAAQPKWGKACIRDRCFDVELALTPEQQAYGLMFRDHLDEDKGMLLILDKERQYSDWMKNMLIPVDILWISEDREVVYINRDTPRCRAEPCPIYTTDKKAKYVLEVNAGIVNRTGISEGDRVSITV